MKNKNTLNRQYQVIVIGAGVAGCSIAGELKRCGLSVGIVDQQIGSARETSAHETALAHPQVGKKISKLQRFTQLANQIANDKWQSAQLFRNAYEPINDLDESSSSQLKELIDEMKYDEQTIKVLNKNEAKAKVNVGNPGIWYETAAIYSLPKICQLEIAELNREAQYWNSKIAKIKYSENVWQAYSEDETLICAAPVCILANGLGVEKLLNSLQIDLPLRPVRGQLSKFRINADSRLVPYLPKTVLRGDGYCLPAQQTSNQDWIWEIGSSYDEDSADKTPWEQSDIDNAIKGLNLIGCDHLHSREMIPISSFVGIRSASKDRLPLIGPVTNQTGLFVACCYGSRGVLWSALAGPLIRAYVEAFFAGADRLRAGFLTGASNLLSAEVASSVNPARFFAGGLGARASNSKPILPDS
jgi:tRNA 5-methylaminomethyl-2-thiouridine biosynthesis bifunctional protein